jgi:hypothetical protein
MLQLLDLARENAELKSELARIRREAEAIQRLLADSSVQSTSGAREDLRATARYEAETRAGEKKRVANADVCVTKAPSNDRRRIACPVARI